MHFVTAKMEKDASLTHHCLRPIREDVHVLGDAGPDIPHQFPVEPLARPGGDGS